MKKIEKNNTLSRTDNIDMNKLSIKTILEIFVGLLDGDGYIEVGPQKQYKKSQDSNYEPKDTIRIRIVLRLHKMDKELLELFKYELNMGKMDELKSKNQYRYIIYKTDIKNKLLPLLEKYNLRFLTHNRKTQFELMKYILDNNITNWENIEMNKVNKVEIKNFEEILDLKYFKYWFVGFTIAEGSFHIKARGTAHYSIVQSYIENYPIIKAIHYFIKGVEFKNHIINPENNKVYRVSFSSKQDINFITKFFDSYKLYGSKKVQYDHWKSQLKLPNGLRTSITPLNMDKLNKN
jgi:LAGLIDADG endonuclease